MKRLHGKTLLVLGFDRVFKMEGLQVFRSSHALGLNAVAYD